jgi:CubicO group peptidase (beta-lactamase class C family)
MDGARLAAAYVTAAEIPHIYSMLVVRHGALVGEAYFGDQTRRTATWVASVGKSIVSALVGVALEEGFLIDLDQRMIDFFPEYDLPELDPRKRQIAIRHLITMTAGYPDDNNNEFFDAVNASSDWMRFCVVDWELETAPGESWDYSNASTHIISGILTKAAGMSLLELANSFIFGRMAQPIVVWPTDPQGFCWGIGQFKSTPLQLASFGQMVLDRGLWRGRPILDAAWLASSLAPITDAPDDSRMDRYHDRHYGYLWWRAEVAGHDVSFAQGHGGQTIVIVPDLDLVVVTTAYDFGDDFSDFPWQTEGRILDLIAAEVIPAAD